MVTAKGSHGRPAGSRNTAQVLPEPLFEAPPEGARSRQVSSSQWTRVAEMLKTRPDEYAKVSTHQTEESAKQAASGIRNGQRSGFEPKNDFEAVFGQVDETEWGVWAKYTGQGSQEIGVGDEQVETAGDEEPALA